MSARFAELGLKREQYAQTLVNADSQLRNHQVQREDLSAAIVQAALVMQDYDGTMCALFGVLGET